LCGIYRIYFHWEHVHINYFTCTPPPLTPPPPSHTPLHKKKQILLGSDRDLFSCKRISSFLYWKGYIIFKAIIYFRDILFLYAFQWYTSAGKRIFMKTSIIFFHYTSVIYQYFDFHAFKFLPFLKSAFILYNLFTAIFFARKQYDLMWSIRNIKIIRAFVYMPSFHSIYFWNYEIRVTTYERAYWLIFETMIYFCHVVFFSFSLLLFLFLSVSVIIERQRMILMIFRVSL